MFSLFYFSRSSELTLVALNFIYKEHSIQPNPFVLFCFISQLKTREKKSTTLLFFEYIYIFLNFFCYCELIEAENQIQYRISSLYNMIEIDCLISCLFYQQIMIVQHTRKSGLYICINKKSTCFLLMSVSISKDRVLQFFIQQIDNTVY